jgi:hypothetical protein
MFEMVTLPVNGGQTSGAQLVEWEVLRSSGGLLSVYRAKVPGGWLVYACNSYHHHGGLTFYPDPTHSWTE